MSLIARYIAILICSLVGFTGIGQERAAALSPPNILYCLADDWGYPHAGAYGDRVVQTPNFDRVAREGVLFTHAFSAAPSCTPSRAAMLTGQAPHRLAEGGNLHGFLPQRFQVYPDLLEAAGYNVGLHARDGDLGIFKPEAALAIPPAPSSEASQTFSKRSPMASRFVSGSAVRIRTERTKKTPARSRA